MTEMLLEPICRHVFDSRTLMEEFPPRFLNPNKLIVYNIACPPGFSARGQMVFTRWRAMELPAAFSPGESTTEVEFREDLFQYEPNWESDTVVEWYLNFADPDLFCAYGGGLLAQDELQVAEHPGLGSLREALIKLGISPRTVEGDEPTPILIMGVERRCVIATDPNPSLGRPQGLYGNNFARAEPDVIRKATTALTPPTITNLIAMAAPSYGWGTYTWSQVTYIVRTAFTGFSAARLESIRHRSSNPTVIVHTGFWGCGAFGGNRILMALLQVLAAYLSGLDKLVFHTFNREGTESFQAAMSLWEKLTSRREKSFNVEDLMHRIEAMGFAWGVSDGT